MPRLIQIRSGWLRETTRFCQNRQGEREIHNLSRSIRRASRTPPTGLVRLCTAREPVSLLG